MDQFVSCMGKAGHAFLLDCRSLEFQFVPIPAASASSSATRWSSTIWPPVPTTPGAQNAKKECGCLRNGIPRFVPCAMYRVELLDQHLHDLPPTIAKRCSHVVRENQRTLDAARALTEGDLLQVGKLMRESHNSLRDLYEVSCRELDVMVDAAQGLPGFVGGRMTGGGFGGCTVNLVREENAEDFAKQIAERYREATGIRPQVYLCTAEDGADELS